MKPTLVILAAGMGSRYGGLKQLDKVGPNGEAIIDFSLFDAIRAGFGKIVFVIREDFAREFKDRFESSLRGQIKTEYIYQSLDAIPSGIPTNPDREKPWGTGQAALITEPIINEPFAIINADDFYGKEAYEEMARFLSSPGADNEYSMIGYKLSNTLSEFGSVSRGVCETGEGGLLVSVNERTKVERKNGMIVYHEDDREIPLSGDEVVSMNFWGLKTSVFKHLNDGFKRFLHNSGMELKSEFYVPILIDEIINKGLVTTKVINCSSKWFGITYKEDKPIVQRKIEELIKSGVYPEKLWALPVS